MVTKLLHSSTDLTDSPWWVRAMAVLGLPTVFACILMYFVLGRLSLALELAARNDVTVINTQSKILEHEDMIIEGHNQLLSALQKYYDSIERNNYYIMCISASDSQTERSKCMSSFRGNR